MSRSLTGGRPAREKEINEIRKSTENDLYEASG